MKFETRICHWSFTDDTCQVNTGKKIVVEAQGETWTSRFVCSHIVGKIVWMDACIRACFNKQTLSQASADEHLSRSLCTCSDIVQTQACRRYGVVLPTHIECRRHDVEFHNRRHFMPVHIRCAGVSGVKWLMSLTGTPRRFLTEAIRGTVLIGLSLAPRNPTLSEDGQFMVHASSSHTLTTNSPEERPVFPTEALVNPQTYRERRRSLRRSTFQP